MSLTLSGTNGVVGAGFTLDPSGASVTAGIATFSSAEVGSVTLNSSSITVDTPAGTEARVNINEGSTTNSLRLFQNAGESCIQVRSSQPLNIKGQSGAGTTSHLAFWTRNSEKVRIAADGKLGIGTTTPSTTVDAIGTVRATSFTATQPEYLRVAHTDASHNQSLSDNVTYTLQFGAEYDDTKDGWTTGSDNYYTIQETGYFLITTQGVLTSSATSSLREWAIGVEKSTDGGSSWSVMMVNGGRGGGNDYTDTDTITPSLTLMEYLAATTRIRVRAWCNVDGGTWQVDEDLSDPLSGAVLGGGTPSVENQKGTRLFIMRLF